MKRVSKIDPDQLTGEPRKIFERWSPGGKPLNIVLIYFRNIELNRTWSYMATHLFLKNSLSDRQREIVVLRISWQCASDYEFIQHVRIAREGGLLSEEEMRDLTKPRLLLDWTEEEKALSDASDELLANHTISDATWDILARHYSEQQLMDMIATAGGYTLNSMATNSFGVDIEDHMSREEGLTPSINEKGFCYGAKQPPVDAELKPRIDALSEDALDEMTGDTLSYFLGQNRFQNFYLTLAKHPKIVRNWSPVIKYVDSENTLTAEERTVVAIRTGVLCCSDYEVANRVADARRSGMNEEHLNSLIKGEAEDHKTSLIIKAVDELVDGQIIGDALWTEMIGHFSEEQLMDIVFGCAIGLMTSWMQSALQVPLEPELKLPAST